MPDGSPNTTPVWVGVEGDNLIVCTGEDSLKVRNLRRDPRLSISVVDFHNPYEEVQIMGRVVDFRDDARLETMDKISHKYIGAPFPMRGSSGRIAMVVEVDKARYTKLPFHHTPPKVS